VGGVSERRWRCQCHELLKARTPHLHQFYTQAMPHLGLQVCFYPKFDGGFYLNGPHHRNLVFRISLGVIDFRLWWVFDQAQRAVFCMELPSNVREPGDGFFFGAESGNSCEYLVQCAWRSQPSAADIAELRQIVNAKSPDMKNQ
jgi:hypothetical protein